MQILFVDESGTPPSPNSRQKYFFIGGVIIPSDKWCEIKNELNTIKATHGIQGEIKWRFFAPHNTDEDNSLSHLNADERNEVRKDIFKIITSRPYLKLLSVVTSVKAAYRMPSVNTHNDLYQITYKPITERFQYYLQDIERNSGEHTNGIIVCDHRNNKDDKCLQELHQKLLNENAAHYSSYPNLIEGLFIAPSHWSVGVQLADMVSGAVSRKFTNDDDKYFDLIKSSFRKSPDGKIEGFGLIKHPKIGWE